MIEIFDLLEFQIMIAARQMKSYYGFSADHEPKPEEVYYAVYQMAHRGILKKQGQDLVIQEPVASYMNGIMNARNLLIVDRGSYVLPRQSIYYDEKEERYICIENSNTAQNQVCLSGWKEEEFFCQMKDLNQLPDEKQKEDLVEKDILLYWKNHMTEDMQNLINQNLNMQTEDLLEQKQIHTVFSDIDKKNGKLKRRMILLDLSFEYGMLIQETDKNVELNVYSREKALAILKNWWRK